MGIVDRVLQCQRRLVINYNPMWLRRHRHIGSKAKRVVGYSPCLLLPPGLGIRINVDTKEMMSLFVLHPEKEEVGTEKEERSPGYRHFLDLGKIPPGIQDIEINTRTMWRGRYLSPEKGLAEFVGSSCGWAAFLDQETCDFYLFNFWIPKKSLCFPYIPLPPIETLPAILGRETSLIDHRKDYINLNYPIPISETKFLCPQKTDYVSSEDMSCCLIKRLALSRAPTPLSYTKIEEEEEECGIPSPMVMIIYQSSYVHGRLAFCSLGDAAWTSLLHHNYSTITCDFPYEDITYFSPHSKFYALTDSKNLEAWDLSCPSSPRVKILKTHGATVREYDASSRTMYLVESEGKLLMVIRHYQGEILAFDVFELTEEDQQLEGSSCWEWMKITSLNGWILFVGVNDCFSLPSYECPGLIPNSIYFTSRHAWGEDGILLGVYDLESESISWFEEAIIRPSPVWIFRSKAY